MTDPRDRCKAQLFRKVRGQKVNASTVQRYLGAFETWNQGPGSQNWPRVARAALGQYSWLAELARREQAWGFWSREMGSVLYTPDGIAATMVALRDARRAEDQEAATTLTNYLRATWTLLATVAQPTAKTTTLYNLRGKLDVDRGDTRFYQGPSVALAGHRNHISNVGQGIVGALLGWALDWPLRHYRRPIVDGLDPKAINGYTWPLKLVEDLLGSPYGAPAPPEPFGLTVVDREHLTAQVRDGDRTADLLPDIARWPIYPGDDSVKYYVRRTTEGTQSWISRTFNPNKPGFPVVSLSPSGTFGVLHPNRWSREGSPPATVEERDGVLIASAEGYTLRQPLFGGDELYRIEWGRRPLRILRPGSPPHTPPA